MGPPPLMASGPHTRLVAGVLLPCSGQQRGRNPPPCPAREGAPRGGGCGSAVLSARVTLGFALRSPSCRPHQEGSLEDFCSEERSKTRSESFSCLRLEEEMWFFVEWGKQSPRVINPFL